LRPDFMDFSKDLSVIILAAGKGRRMRSETPKVLHRLCGKPMIYHILKQVQALGPKNIFAVIGHKKEEVRKYLKDSFPGVLTIDQDKQLGTAHAVMTAESHFDDMGGNILVLSGDCPLITTATLKALAVLRSKKDLSASILTYMADDPYGYGRIVKDARGKIARIVEEKDASLSQKQIDEVNSSIYCFKRQMLVSNIRKIGSKNSQGEHYLTDIVEMFMEKGEKVETYTAGDSSEAGGINDRVQLAAAEGILQQRINRGHMENGVTIRNPSSVYIEDTVAIEPDSVIEPSCMISGDTFIGRNSVIGAFSRIDGCRIGIGTRILNSVILDSDIGPDNNIGPYSYIRPNTVTGSGVKIGAFCEVKKSSVGRGSKVPHLSYVGDTEIGSGVNIGASSVTVNYNGFSKFKTIIEDDAFIGSDSMLIAPVRIGRGAIVAAGSVITRDVQADDMAIERAKQRNIRKGAAKYRKRKQEKK
jgi:bifunctional UDP-N-acetylglucosamine pyrophosphorylase / glucosamine-1-phosphate N-acetyltransferase